MKVGLISIQERINNASSTSRVHYLRAIFKREVKNA